MPRLLLLAVGCTAVSLGQTDTDTATLSGTVQDPSASGVPGATLTLTNNATRLKRSAQ